MQEKKPRGKGPCATVRHKEKRVKKWGEPPSFPKKPNKFCFLVKKSQKNFHLKIVLADAHKGVFANSFKLSAKILVQSIALIKNNVVSLQ